MSFARLGNIPELAKQLEAESSSGKTIRVLGPSGSGRLTLALELRRLLGDRGVHVGLPPFQGFDGPTHGLLQLAAGLSDANAMARARDADRSIEDRAESLVSIARQEARVIVLQVPESWRALGDVSVSRQRRESMARGLLRGVTSGRASVIVIAHDDARDMVGEDDAIHSLEPPQLEEAALQDSSRWGAYGAAFERARSCDGANLLTPIQLRVLVGAVALGEDPQDLVASLAGLRDLRPVVDRLSELLSTPEHRSMAEAFVRFATPRFPVEKELALRLAAPPPEHVPFFTSCVAYEQDGCLRIPDQVRVEISRALRRLRPNWRTHEVLAAHHRGLDGAAAPPHDASKITHWLERVHHLGHMGQRGEAEWTSLDLVGPEQVLDRAWSLSFEHKAFDLAATLYRRILKDDRRDDYAWHYLGFNLERARAPRAEIEDAYREAVRLAPSNPWWNSRLVTYLIKDLRYDAADKEWGKTLERVDPRGERVRKSPLLARNLHRWIVEEWLRHGEVERAKRAYLLIPRRWLTEDVALQTLRQRFEDALESVTLGESVYPVETPIGERWRATRLLEKHWNDGALREWMPGRITAVTEETVSFVVAQPGSERRVFKRTASTAEWRAWSGAMPEADQFFEMGFYGDDMEIVHVRPVNTFGMMVEEDEDAVEVLSAKSVPSLDAVI